VNGFTYLLGASDLCAVTETVVVFLYLFALLISIAVSYGCYLLTAMFFSSEQAAEMSGTKTINLITWRPLLIGGLFLFPWSQRRSFSSLYITWVRGIVPLCWFELLQASLLYG
jgi:hypothetical protein